jgi:two-component system, chemotaxis family, sensor kinase CheA
VSELLQQFIIESRELIESASDGLQSLEQSPRDTEHIDAVLRAFHTLKGGAGIVKFIAMERTMHAAEDILSTARTGERPMTPTRFAQCLACLDQALQWLEIVEQTGELPEQSARQADQVISELGAPDDDARIAAGGSSERPRAIWLEEIGDKHPLVRARAATAVRFVPAADSFYQAEDPLARMMSLPGLLALDCAPTSVWGPLDSLDPFVCNLTLTALSAAPPAEVVAHMKGHTGECDIVPAASEVIEGAEQPLPLKISDVVKAQGLLLSESTPEDFVGRVASAGLAAANALRFCGRLQQAHMLSRATERSLLERSAQPLRQALADLFTAVPPVAAVGPELLQPANVAARTVRVDADRVDALVRLAGELMVVKNAIGHVAKLAIAGDRSVPEILKDRHGDLERLVAELQRSVLGMRVRSLRAVLQRFPPLV